MYLTSLRCRARLAPALFCLAWTALGCSAIDSVEDATIPSATLDGVAFESDDTLELSPSQKIAIQLTSTAGSKVSLLLLGDALDASLDESIVWADGAGSASVVLTAPSQPTTFILRAQLNDGSSDELVVAVSEQGFTTLRVLPSYKGQRALDGSWSSDVVVGGDCPTLLSSYPDGPIGALHVDSQKGSQPTIGSVPVGPTLAVAVRSGLLVQGCVTYVATKPDGLEEVAVEAFDNPMVLTSAKLEVTLGFVPDEASFGPMIKAASDVVADVSFPPDTPVATILLDSMEQALAAPAALELSTLRAGTTLEQDLATSLDGVSLNGLCRSLSEGSAIAAVADASSNTSGLKGLFEGSPDAGGFATFTLVSFQGLSADQVGAPASIPISWQANGDFLLVSGSLPIASSRLAGAYMNHQASTLVGDTTTVPEMLASAVDCPTVAGMIAAHGGSACDSVCLEEACSAALATRWSEGLAVSDSADGSLGRLDVSLGGDVVVDSQLLPATITGSWTGSLVDETNQVACDGGVTGQAPPPQ